ncbi:CoA-transferase [Actinomadura luteofluorescens]|uniref:CoA-transferase n=1 Tax=Actinomadura luteofluorescens TaxID=46163 RepID=UPI003D8FE7DD
MDDVAAAAVGGKVCDAATAAALVGDGQSVASTGVIGWITPDAVLRAIGERFERLGSPRDLTFFFPCATGDAMDIGGMDGVAREGLMRRIVAGSYINPRHPRTGTRPALTELIRDDRIEAYSWPIGAAMHWLREVARRSPGYLTRIGLGTFADPRHGGGRLTGRAKDDLVEVVELRGEELLLYPTWPLDVGIIRASSSDDQGNLSFEDMPLTSAALALALAVKASGGTVIAQVSRIVPRGSRPAREVQVPGALVDRVVVAAGELIGTEVRNDPGYLRPVPHPVERLPRLRPGPGKVIARRVAREIRPGETTILGFGAASSAILAMAEDGAFRDGRLGDYTFTTEHGSFGGVVMGGWQFSANYSPEALVDGTYQFDFIDGGGCALAALSFAQLDAAGNVNVSRFAGTSPGGGGFVDIAHNARRIVLGGTLTTKGLDVSCDGGRLDILREGEIQKLVPEVDHITYAVRAGLERGQRATVVTERAVFEMTAEGLVLTEVAPGVDVRRDVLGQIGFPVRTAAGITTMPSELFRP